MLPGEEFRKFPPEFESLAGSIKLQPRLMAPNQFHKLALFPPKTDLLPTITVVSSLLLSSSFILHSENIVKLILIALVYMAIIYSRMLFHGGTWASLSGTVGHMKTQTRSSSAHWAKENIPVKTFVGGQIQARFIAQGKPCRYKAEKMQKGNIG